MRKRVKLMVLVAFVLVVGLISCGYNRKDLLVIPDDKYKANYDKMFDAALSTSVKLGYKPTYQDKNSGMISLEKDMGIGDIFKIIINFGNVQGGKGFEISGAAAPMTIGSSNGERDLITIKNAISRTAGMP